jgi:tetratricopeptide (TPR) repeat protein
LPAPDQFLVGNDQAAFAEMLQQLSKVDPSDWKAELGVFDATLAKLREPTKFRGMVQYSRASALAGQGRYPEAQVAAEESIRLLPGYSGPLIQAAWIYSYAGRASQGADYLLRASQQDPAAVREVEDYELGSLLLRLKNDGDDRRVATISERLLEIGWLGTNVSSRSGLALEAIQHRISQGDVAGARSLVPNLLVPGHSRTLLAGNKYSQVWPDVEKWTGPKLERQWILYLAEARARWTTSRTLEDLREYAQALLAAGHEQSVIRDVLPPFQKPLKDEDFDLMFVAAGLAGALARDGRWDDIDALYANAEKAWPLGSSALALNIAANRARWLLWRGSYVEALKLMDSAIADARGRGAEVNADALATMHHYRACMLHELGRTEEALASAAAATMPLRPENTATMHLCMDNMPAARKVLIEALSNEANRDNVLAFVQKVEERPVKSDYGRKMSARTSALQKDPELLSQVGKYGRILPYTLKEGAPPERLPAR